MTVPGRPKAFQKEFYFGGKLEMVEAVQCPLGPQPTRRVEKRRLVKT